MKTTAERRDERRALFERLNTPSVVAAAEIMHKEDVRYITPDMWGRFASNAEKAAALIDAGWTPPAPQSEETP